ncbi:MAG: VWA domain-containing protein, partial [Oscillospiraceae bacterium]|nr:VWA domain-containing protein [Oscillospiraceae bacterium]
MRKVLISILLITLVVNCFSFVVFAEENDEPAIDVVFIMDLSGSMNYADSEKVSLTSVSIFADLLENSSSQIGYVTFSTNVIESMPLTPVTHARSRIRNNLMTSGFDGQTNIPDALDDALRLFNSTTSTNQRVAILFTDGNIVMPSSSGLNQQQGEERCRNTARAFGDAGIPLYTIGLNFDGSLNMKFLQDLAELSSSPGNAARDYEAKTNWDIPEIFSKIYISLFNGNADVSLNFDASEGVQIANFYADEDIYELNILLIHNNALEDLEIRMPGGGEYRETTFQQREQDGYSFVKIRYPDVGNWEFSFRGDYVSANRLVRYITVRPPV